MALPMPPVTDGLVYFADADHHFEVNGATTAFITNRVGDVLLDGPSTYTTLTAAELADITGDAAPDNNGHRVFDFGSGETGGLLPLAVAGSIPHDPTATATDLLITARTWPPQINAFSTLVTTYIDIDSPWPEGIAYTQVGDGVFSAFSLTWGDPPGAWITFESLPAPWAMLTAERNPEPPILKFARDMFPLRVAINPADALFDTTETWTAILASPHGCYAALRYDRVLTDDERQQIYDWAASWSAPQGSATSAVALSCASILVSWDQTVFGEVVSAQRVNDQGNIVELGPLTYPFLDTMVPASGIFYYVLDFDSGELRTTDPAASGAQTPMSVVVTDVSDKTTTVTWEGDGSSALIFVNDVPVAYRVDSPYTVIGLTPETAHTVRVECATTLGEAQFTTLPPIAPATPTVFYSMGGEWVEASAVYASSGGVWKEQLEIHGSLDGAWHQAAEPGTRGGA